MEDRMEFPEGYRWLFFVSGGPIRGCEHVTVQFLRGRDLAFERYSDELLEMFLQWLCSRGDLYRGLVDYRFTNSAIEVATKMREGGFATFQGSIFVDHPNSQASRSSAVVNDQNLARPLLSVTDRLALATVVPPASAAKKVLTSENPKSQESQKTRKIRVPHQKEKSVPESTAKTAHPRQPYKSGLRRPASFQSIVHFQEAVARLEVQLREALASSTALLQE